MPPSMRRRDGLPSWPWLLGSRVESLEHLLQLIGLGLHTGIEAAAGYFDGHDGRHAIRKARETL